MPRHRLLWQHKLLFKWIVIYKYGIYIPYIILLIIRYGKKTNRRTCLSPTSNLKYCPLVEFLKHCLGQYIYLGRTYNNPFFFFLFVNHSTSPADLINVFYAFHILVCSYLVPSLNGDNCVSNILLLEREAQLCTRWGLATATQPTTQKGQK